MTPVYLVLIALALLTIGGILVVLSEVADKSGFKRRSTWLSTLGAVCIILASFVLAAAQVGFVGGLFG